MDSETRRWTVAEDAVVPDLVDRLERQADELARLRSEIDGLHTERETLKTELTIARRWVHTLALELELADKQLKEARPLLSRIGIRVEEPATG
jgi:chromosome segregation ATPase